jgi:general secretion pathway protein I
MIKALKRQHGFTLLETILALIIMATSILLLANSWGSSFQKLKKAQSSFQMSALIERKMAELDTKYRDRPLEEIPDSDGGEFDEESGYSWKMISKKLEFPDFSSSLVAQQGGADQNLIMVVKQLTETLSKSVKEVKVTVSYKPENAPKALEQSITTYYVDYSKAGTGIPGLPGG